MSVFNDIMLHQLHQAIRNTSSQTLTCTIHVPKFINSRLQLKQYLKRVNSINKNKCLRSPSVVQWQWEPGCQQLWSAVGSLAAPHYWSRPSLTWFENPRALTFFAIENKHIPILRKYCPLPLPLPMNMLPDLSYQPLNTLAIALTAQSLRTAQAGRGHSTSFMGEGVQVSLFHTVQKHLETLQ